MIKKAATKKNKEEVLEDILFRCRGSGGMFVRCAKFVEQYGGNTLGTNVYGQESDPTTYRLAKMNLAVRGLSYNLGDRYASTFTNDQHRGRTFDYIMANPPFNLKKVVRQ